MIKLLTTIIILFFTSYNQNRYKSLTEVNKGLKPFEFTIYDSDYSMAYTLQYVLTEKEIKVIFIGQLEDEKSLTRFKKKLRVDETLKAISNINIASLKEYYTNPCIQDGSQLSINFEQNGKNKNVHLSNYYQPDVGQVIEFINNLVPKKYKIWYDKKTLLEYQRKCLK